MSPVTGRGGNFGPATSNDQGRDAQNSGSQLESSIRLSQYDDRSYTFAAHPDGACTRTETQ